MSKNGVRLTQMNSVELTHPENTILVKIVHQFQLEEEQSLSYFLVRLAECDCCIAC